jgi:hypothetical protein
VRRRVLVVVLPALGLAGLLLLLAAWPPLRAELLEIGRLLVAGDRSGVRDHLRAFGPWAPVVSAALILGQAVVARRSRPSR